MKSRHDEILRRHIRQRLIIPHGIDVHMSGLPEDMERFVTLTVRRTGNMTAIHTENPCAGVIPFEEGMPKSAGDPEWHGFGMRSMERIAEKYGGTLSAQQTGSLFSVDILLLDPAGP